MAAIVIDRSADIVLVKDTEVIVSPLCGGQPPPLRLSSPSLELFARALRAAYGGDAAQYLVDQRVLGLDDMDPVLLLGQLPLEKSHLAFLLPYRGVAAGCVSAYPTPALAAIATLSNAPASAAVDFRWDLSGLAEVMDLAARLGVDLQVIVPRPVEVRGEVYLTESVPGYIRRRLVGAFKGNVGPGGEEFTPIIKKPQGGGQWKEVEYWRAAERVAEVLGMRQDSLGEIAELGFLAHRTILDLGIGPGQLGYLIKWGLLEPIAGGFRAGDKLLYLLSLSGSVRR
ncbi:MAG: hypothetical protein ACP5KY_01395 [Thermoproteus sp.]